MSMNVDEPSKLATLRPYVFDYVTGVLWLLAGAAAILRTEYVVTLAVGVDNVASKMPHATIPAFVTGFFLVIAGVILPYCLNVIVKMPTLELMNRFLKLQRRRNTSRQARAAAQVQQSAISTIQRSAGIGSDVSSNFALLYLETLQPTVAAGLRTTRQEIDFRASSALPIALIVGLAAGRIANMWLLTSASFAIGFVVGLASLFLAVWSTNQALDNTYEDLAVALLIADHRRTTRDESISPVPKEEQLPQVQGDAQVSTANDKSEILPESTA